MVRNDEEIDRALATLRTTTIGANWVRPSELRHRAKVRGIRRRMGIALTLAAASAHHVTLIFGSVLFAVPVLWLAWYDGRHNEQPSAPIIGRGFVFAAIAAVGVGVVLLPYWIAIIRHPIEQLPIPHASRSNFLMNWTYGMNYFIVPYGALILALPFIVVKGASTPRLRMLLIAFWATFLIALGGTTPVPRWISISVPQVR